MTTPFTAPRKNGKQGSPRRDLFVKEYLVDLNATQAAIRCGYSKKTADRAGSRLLRNVEVQREVSEAMAKRAGKLELTAERVLAELALIAFSDPRQFAKWNKDGVVLEDSETLDPDHARCIAEVSSSPGPYGTTIKFKLHDKKGAIELLGKHMKLFTDRIEHTADLDLARLFALGRSLP